MRWEIVREGRPPLLYIYNGRWPPRPLGIYLVFSYLICWGRRPEAGKFYIWCLALFCSLPSSDNSKRICVYSQTPSKRNRHHSSVLCIVKMKITSADRFHNRLHQSPASTQTGFLRNLWSPDGLIGCRIANYNTLWQKKFSINQQSYQRLVTFLSEPGDAGVDFIAEQVHTTTSQPAKTSVQCHSSCRNWCYYCCSNSHLDQLLKSTPGRNILQYRQLLSNLEDTVTHAEFRSLSAWILRLQQRNLHSSGMNGSTETFIMHYRWMSGLDVASLDVWTSVCSVVGGMITYLTSAPPEMSVRPIYL